MLGLIERGFMLGLLELVDCNIFFVFFFGWGNINKKSFFKWFVRFMSFFMWKVIVKIMVILMCIIVFFVWYFVMGDNNWENVEFYF